VLEAATEFFELRTVVDAEDGADDDVEGDGLHLVMDREGTAERPARDRAAGAVTHEPAVDVHPLAVERWRHQLALAQMALAVEHQE
jgi:hypothetical protein